MTDQHLSTRSDVVFREQGTALNRPGDELNHLHRSRSHVEGSEKAGVVNKDFEGELSCDKTSHEGDSDNEGFLMKALDTRARHRQHRANAATQLRQQLRQQ